MDEAIELELDETGQDAFIDILAGSMSLSKALKEAANSVELISERLGTNLEVPKKAVGVSAFVEKVSLLSKQIKNDSFRKSFEKDLDSVKSIFSTDSRVEKRFKSSFKFVQKDEGEERTVFGIVLEPEQVDAQGDIYSEEEIRNTAWKFMENHQNFGLMHETIVPSILPLESYITQSDTEIHGQKIKKGSWLLRVRVLDSGIWNDVKTGRLTGFSIGGSAVRKPDNPAPTPTVPPPTTPPTTSTQAMTQ